MEDIARGANKNKGPNKRKKKQANFYKPSISPLKKIKISVSLFSFLAGCYTGLFAKGAPFFLRPPYFFILQPELALFFFFY
jgi:hypothetical protein